MTAEGFLNLFQWIQVCKVYQYLINADSVNFLEWISWVKQGGTLGLVERNDGSGLFGTFSKVVDMEVLVEKELLK